MGTGAEGAKSYGAAGNNFENPFLPVFVALAYPHERKSFPFHITEPGQATRKWFFGQCKLIPQKSATDLPYF